MNVRGKLLTVATWTLMVAAGIFLANPPKHPHGVLLVLGGLVGLAVAAGWVLLVISGLRGMRMDRASRQPVTLRSLVPLVLCLGIIAVVALVILLVA